MDHGATVKIKVVGEGITTTTAKINGLTKSIRTVEKSGNTTTTTIKNFGLANQEATKKTRGLVSQMFGAGLALMAVHKAMSFVTDEIKRGITGFREFETRIQEINTILTDQEEDILPALKQGIEAMAIAYGQSTSDIAKGMYDILSAAFAAEDAIVLLDIATRSSIAGLTDVKTSVDIFTTVLNSYGFSAYRAQDISDKLFQSLVRGKFVFADLEAALGYVAPIAAQAGVSIDELGAAFATTTRHGLHLDMASRGLALMIQGFINPTKEAAMAAEEYGIRMDSVFLKTRGLSGVMEEISDASKEYGSQILPEIVKNMRSLRVAMVLASEEGFDGFIKDVDLSTKAIGRLNTAYEEMMDTQARQAAKVAEERKKIEREFGDPLGWIVIELEKVAVQAAKQIRWALRMDPITSEIMDETQETYTEWASKIDLVDDKLKAEVDIIIALNNALSDYHKELRQETGYSLGGEEILGTKYLELERLKADKELADVQHDVKRGMIDEIYNYKQLSSAGQTAVVVLRDYKNQQEENRNSMQRYTLAIQANNLEMMKLQLKGMMRRRGLGRSERKRMKQLQIENLQERISAEENNKQITVSDYDRYVESRKILDKEIADATEKVYYLNYTFDEELRVLDRTLKLKEQYYKDDETALTTHMQNMAAIRQEKYGLVKEIVTSPNLREIFGQREGYNEFFMKVMGMEAKRGRDKGPLWDMLSRRAGFQTGTYRVPRTGLAMVHEGEQVIPKGGRGRSGFGGKIHVDPMHINVNIYDHTDVEHLVQKIELAIQGGLVSGITTGYS